MNQILMLYVKCETLLCVARVPNCSDLKLDQHHFCTDEEGKGRDEIQMACGSGYDGRKDISLGDW